MALEPDQIPEAVDAFITEHEATSRAASPVEHAARPAHLAAVEAYRVLGQHIIDMGKLVLRSPWDDAAINAAVAKSRQLAEAVDPAMERLRLLRDCQGAMH